VSSPGIVEEIVHRHGLGVHTFVRISQTVSGPGWSAEQLGTPTVLFYRSVTGSADANGPSLHCRSLPRIVARCRVVLHRPYWTID